MHNFSSEIDPIQRMTYSRCLRGNESFFIARVGGSRLTFIFRVETMLIY